MELAEARLLSEKPCVPAVITASNDELCGLCRDGKLFAVDAWFKSGGQPELSPKHRRNWAMGIAIERGFHSLVEVLLKNGFPADGKTLWEAVNRDLDEMAKNKTFRADLLARFTDRYVMPPLRQRMEDLHFILDCLLQSEAINPEGKVSEVGRGAFEAIERHEFRGNFRELETVMRAACQAASKDGRPFICVHDLSGSGGLSSLDT